MPAKDILIVHLFASVLLFSSCTNPNHAIEKKFTRTHRMMGTYVKIIFYAKSKNAADNSIEKVLAAMRKIEKNMGYKNPKGELAEINRL
ncbi:MAG: hypothetical protein AB1546_04615, partial [bacterium]